MNLTLEEWNEYYVDIFIPNIVWNIVCLSLGVIGNSLVLFVYIFRIKQNREDRYFIPILAVFDLFATLFSAIYYITDYLYYVTYPSSFFCTFINFVSFFTSGTSAHFLLVIGIQRYLKICRPLSAQMTLFWRRFAVVLTMSVASSYSIPILFAAGNKEINWNFKGQNITGVLCSINAENKATFAKIFYPATLLIIVLNILATTVVYFPVARVIYRTFHTKKKALYEISVVSSDCTKDTSPATGHFSSETVIDDVTKTDTDKAIESTSVKKEDNSRITYIKMSNTNINHSDSLSEKKRSPNATNSGNRSRKKKKRINFNCMFLTVVAFYLIAYIPTGVMFVISSLERNYWFKLSALKLGIFMCLERFYILNHVVNPVIYGYFDIYFRRSLKMILKCKRA